MKVFKPDDFKKQKPGASVILPIFSGERSPHLQRLLSELKRQTFRDFEVIVAAAIEPNGRARNEAVKEALGEWLVLIDETTSLGHERVIENLLKPFLSKTPRLGMTGSAMLPPTSLKNFQRQYFMMRTFESQVVRELTPSRQVQHPCMAIPKAIYQEVGWESDCLITGTDDDLRARADDAGYSRMLVPDTWCYYLPPDNLRQILRKGFRKGKGSAYALMIFPGLFPFASLCGRPIRSAWPALFYKLASGLAKMVHPKFLFNPVALLYEWVGIAGFAAGLVQWIGARPAGERWDLPGVRAKKA